MSSDKDKRALVARPGYDVGYGKPPKDTRFKAGQSGNPKGRPRGAKNKRPGMHEERMKDLILDEAYRDITIREGHRSVTIPMAQAVMRSLAVNAAKGQHRSQRLFSELLASVESSRKILHDQWLDTAITYKVEWEKELRRREQLGITDLPDPLPHPDHVKIDMVEGTARVVGPATKEEKAEYDWFVERREMFEDELQHLQDLRAEAKDKRLISQIDEDIGQVRRILQIVDAKLPD
ncbi:hypothetical protein AVO45_10370 [Ruegeria marisrubri]|uniref:DUF5681 domain-containing protein n=1 Tax=Ruegeria marisrubri TaxID=1685379 RepID=A0A0X3TMJ1_9RHOB|nr:DUF5681 domain-containing protein [Ruegeria marisrubri]KUJ76889.1 hypothetical protein AVO45_10370 [Ruegeria marisrubri]